FFTKVVRFTKTAAVVILAMAAAAAIAAGGYWSLSKLRRLASASGPAGAQTRAPARDPPPQSEPPLEPAMPKTIDSGTGLMVLVSGTDKVRSFYIDKYEVTNQLYKEFSDATGRKYPPNPAWDSHYFEKRDYPVINVSWYDARAYAEWAGKRLPA